MSEKIMSILLIEDDKAACYELSRYIEKFDDLKLIGITKNASEGVSMVCSMPPDVVILDIELHSGTGNGIMFLAELNAGKPARRPYILITTNNSSPATYDMIRHLGADFIMAKCKPSTVPGAFQTSMACLPTILRESILKRESLPPLNLCIIMPIRLRQICNHPNERCAVRFIAFA